MQHSRQACEDVALELRVRRRRVGEEEGGVGEEEGGRGGG